MHQAFYQNNKLIAQINMPWPYGFELEHSASLVIHVVHPTKKQKFSNTPDKLDTNVYKGKLRNTVIWHTGILDKRLSLLKACDAILTNASTAPSILVLKNEDGK